MIIIILLLLLPLLLFEVVNPFIEMDCETIGKLLIESLRHEVEIISEESDKNFIEEPEENTDTEQKVNSSVEGGNMI